MSFTFKDDRGNDRPSSLTQVVEAAREEDQQGEEEPLISPFSNKQYQGDDEDNNRAGARTERRPADDGPADGGDALKPDSALEILAQVNFKMGALPRVATCALTGGPCMQATWGVGIVRSQVEAEVKASPALFAFETQTKRKRILKAATRAAVSVLPEQLLVVMALLPILLCAVHTTCCCIPGRMLCTEMSTSCRKLQG